MRAGKATIWARCQVLWEINVNKTIAITFCHRPQCLGSGGAFFMQQNIRQIASDDGIYSRLKAFVAASFGWHWAPYRGLLVGGVILGIAETMTKAIYFFAVRRCQFLMAFLLLFCL